MCHRDELQKRASDKLDEELVGVPTFIKRFFKSKPKLKSKLSQKEYWRTFKQFFNYLIENEVIKAKTIEDITDDDIKMIKASTINQYIIYCRDELNNEDGTISTKFNALKSLFSYFVDDEIITRNITRTIAVDKPEKKELRYATLDDKKELIHNIESMKNEYDRIRNVAIIQLLFGSGVRISELVGLDMKDLHIVVSEGEEPYIIVKRKGGATDRVLINLDAKMSMEEYLLIRPERVCEENKHIVFISEKEDQKLGCKGRMTEDSIRKFMTAYSGEKKITPHMLRKGLGMVIANSEDGDLMMAAEQLGHSSTATTMRWYATTDKKRKAKVLNSF